jgi:hypothetical protein
MKDPILILKRQRDQQGRETETFIGQVGDPERADEIAKEILRNEANTSVFGKKKGENFTRYGANTEYGSIQVDLFNKSDSEIRDLKNEMEL